MATIGNISAFDVSKPTSWDVYVEQIEFFCRANSITEPDMKTATLLTVMGSSAYKILRSLISPESPGTKTFEELTEVLRQHFMPQTSLIYKRFLFHKRFQLKDESIAAYVTELRRLAEDCEFGSTLTERLRDQLVCGLRDDGIQGRLLSETSLTYDDAVKRAQAGEAAATQVKELQAQKPSTDALAANQLRHTKSAKKVHTKNPSSTPRNPCASCGGSHSRQDCKFRNAVCNFCHKKGHIAKACRSRSSLSKSGNKKKACSSSGQLAAHMVDETSDEAYAPNFVNSVGQTKPAKVHIEVQIQGRPCTMEVDSGSDFSVISMKTYSNLWPVRGPVIQPFTSRIRDYQKNPIQLKGYCEVKVAYKCYEEKLRLLVAKGDRASLLGLEWFTPLGLSIQGVHQTHSEDSIQALLEEFADVFKEDLGTYKGPKVTLPIDPKVPPIRLKARNVPLAIRPRIESEIQRLLREKVLEPISNPKWSTPVVPVIKPNGAIRLCGDYKTTINTSLQDHPYPVPSVNHLLSNLSGGGYYAKIDMAQAYLQLPVDDASAEAQTIITHMGAFKVNRLQFGVCIAPGIFQQVMDDVLKDIPGTTPYFDDVLIRGTTLSELTDRLRVVLKTLRSVGLHARKEKCLFGVTSVDFLGYRIDASGIHPSKSKMEAIHNAPVPQNKKELQTFLGLLNFYNSFLKDKATVAEPLHRLLDKGAAWRWTKRHEQSFKAVKRLLTSESVLVPFDTSLPTILTCDANPFGVGAVLSQVQENGKEATVAFASRTLTQAERNYAQIDREALALISGVKKFHHFLYGRPFTLVTDHKPLLDLFSPSKGTPDIISPRMLRWSILLNAYSYKLIHKPGVRLGNADALSRLSHNDSRAYTPSPPEVLFIEELAAPALTAAEIAQFTQRDPELSRVLNWVWKGWPTKSEAGFQAYFMKRNELTVHKKCLLWGNRVVIPKEGQQRVLDELHLTHPGVVRMKALARSYVWWPNIDSDIERYVGTCTVCQEHQHAPPRASIHPWEVPRNPWSRLHVDFAGPFQGERFLVVVDAYSKWLEVKRMTSTTAANTIKVLRELFATHGLPDSIVSDNGPQFTSDEFQRFCKDNLITPIRVSPYHASSNGQAERMVQTTKDSLAKMLHGSWEKRLARFLLASHVTPSTTTGLSPAELLMGRKLKICLDRLHPDYAVERQLKQDAHLPTHVRDRGFYADEPVYIRNYETACPWTPAVISRPTGPVSYEAKTPDGRTVKRHADQIQKRISDATSTDVPPATPTMTQSSGDSVSSAEPIVTPRPKRTLSRPAYLKDYVC
uniref:RNA-directed DNA polymerase n=1 Tax=Trichuris muris TaxID=70415 RepID=A0A5S6Q373_TRIMR